EDEADRELLAGKIAQLVGDIQQGSTQDGQVGVRQLREMLDAMVSNEQPPYVTVDQWYLFHLVRLPKCDNCWAWRKWANSGNRGY
ncbi:MAG: hypothetical protein NXH95_17890, partial [Pseudomonadaceae bacterium]|nr:hypothetical protein [Pseudomonadaceae bacterium]